MAVVGSEKAGVTRGERIYFAAVGVLALWVGFWGYFVPSEVERAIPFSVPPLHARFLGAVYLSGLTIMIGGLLARSWREIRLVPILTALWTGGLCVISLFYLDRFDFATPQPWVWFAAYVIYPLIALGLAWRHRLVEPAASATEVPGWARRYLVGQGVVLTAVAMGLLLAPGVLADVWPWPIDQLLAQIYSAPLLAYGVGSLLLARQRTLIETRVVVAGILVFTAGVLIASIIHRELFSADDVEDVLWFGLLVVANTMLGVLLLLASRQRR
ncbi:MAG: hypothetical protein WAL70_12660 [Aeromicrobium sp.]